MDISSIKGKLPNEILESLSARGLREFTEPQEEAIKKGLLSFKNMVVSSPTASGKTLVAEIACANSILAKGKKAIYIAPMRALATEKFNEFKEAYPYIKTAISIGDLDSTDPWLRDYEMMFFSTEKFDSLLRHGIDWLSTIGCIVFDEIHMLDDSSRGPTLEILITKLANICRAQIIALSATIGNASEIAKWLAAELVVSDYRPVKLVRGVVHDGKFYYNNSNSQDIDEEQLGGSNKIPEIRVLEDTLMQNKQMLLFYSTKRNAETGATRLSLHVSGRLNKEEIVELEELSNKVLNVLERPTEQCVKLASLIKKGVAFHHAGLLNLQRNYIEGAFKSNKIKAVCSTTTLGFGVNLPAHTVLVRDISRFDENTSERIGVNEMLQLFGRAGRPQYDKEGRALIIASTKERISELYKHYILAEPEPVESSLGIAPVLRTHVLAFIAEDFLNDESSMQKFLAKSFYSFQYGNQRHINNMIEGILDDLTRWRFIEKKERNVYLATKLGKRVSELYIDPLSAKWIVDSLDKELDTIGILYTISNTLEMRPHVRATNEAEEEYVSYMYINRNSVSNEFLNTEYGYYDPVKAFSTALMLRDWIGELKEPELVKKYSSTPGALYTKLTNADWLIYAAVELSRIMHRSAHKLIETRVRLRYGIKEELLDLVRLEQMGRVRARMLYANGIKRASEIKDNRERVVKILGKEIAEKIFKQLD